MPDVNGYNTYYYAWHDVMSEALTFKKDSVAIRIYENSNAGNYYELKKDEFEVKEAPGFVVNRILIPMINEACFICQEGLASVEDIDTAMKLGANHPMGPLALGDLIGLDIVLDVMEVLYTETGDPKYRPCTLLKKMVRAGKLGQKTKQGFYSYNQ